MSKKYKKLSENQPSVQFYFGKKKQQLNFDDKCQFIASKSDEIIQKTLNKEVLENDEENAQKRDIELLREQNKILEKNLKQAKILLRKANDINMQKDMQIKLLQKKLNKIETCQEKNELLFQTHTDRFDSLDLKRIRSIKAGKRNDSTFILAIMRALYKNQESKLKERRVTKRDFKGSKKFEISADKKEIMRGMFEERISNELGESDESINRIKKLNEVMRFALHNSVKTYENASKTATRNNSTPKKMETTCSKTDQVVHCSILSQNKANEVKKGSQIFVAPVADTHLTQHQQSTAGPQHFSTPVAATQLTQHPQSTTGTHYFSKPVTAMHLGHHQQPTNHYFPNFSPIPYPYSSVNAASQPQYGFPTQQYQFLMQPKWHQSN